MDYLEIQFWKIAKWLIRRGYGADCLDFNADCSACQAAVVIMWIEDHIDLLKGLRVY